MAAKKRPAPNLPTFKKAVRRAAKSQAAARAVVKRSGLPSKIKGSKFDDQRVDASQIVDLRPRGINVNATVFKAAAMQRPRAPRPPRLGSGASASASSRKKKK